MDPSPSDARSSILIFPNLDPRDSEPTTFRLSRVDDPGLGVELMVSKTTLIHDGHSKVYRATIDRLGDERISVEVVCKIATGKRNIDRLRHESAMYFELQELQGMYVPECYGLYIGDLEDGPAAVLVTAYYGKTLDMILSRTSWDFRVDVVTALVEIHDCGVEHGDFREANIVVGDDGKPYIVDFDRAKVHQCQRSQPIKLRARMPDMLTFGCKELWWACSHAQIWRPIIFRFMEHYVDVKYAKSVEKLATLAPQYMSKEEALEEAQQAIDDYKKDLARREHGAKWGVPHANRAQ